MKTTLTKLQTVLKMKIQNQTPEEIQWFIKIQLTHQLDLTPKKSKAFMHTMSIALKE